jgi:hypothetical protein
MMDAASKLTGSELTNCLCHVIALLSCGCSSEKVAVITPRGLRLACCASPRMSDPCKSREPNTKVTLDL